ncbi:MAG: tetraacyldisaccharide 4'-kinase [Deltaproteobacteria bacterium]|nr:MAG: tetraacyldisaccharide 4'-kinase [Deltaproteobacteria bacterium]
MDKIVNFHRHLVSQGARNFQERLLLFLLLPFSYLYGVIVWVRNRCYQFGWFSSYRASLPVVSVGNLAVGGTGKTPVVDWLVKEFQKQGKRPAVVSRGFAGNFSGDVGVVSSGAGILMTAAECGDEPCLLAKRNPDCPVFIAKKRVDAIKIIESSKNVDLIILDDGFQHQAVKRDVDLVLLDSTSPLGNGKPLPAGNLREFPGALKRADLLLMTRAGVQNRQHFMGFKVYESYHQLSTTAISLDGQAVPVSQLSGLKVLAFAGIADPENFFVSLENAGFRLDCKLGFADHVTYQGEILNKLQLAAADVDALITTEKDAVKLSADMFELPCYQLPMDIKINNSKELFDRLTNRLWSQ